MSLCADTSKSNYYIESIQELALNGVVQQSTPYYKYSPKQILENDRSKIYWDRSVITERIILVNKPEFAIMGQ